MIPTVLLILVAMWSEYNIIFPAEVIANQDS